MKHLVNAPQNQQHQFFYKQIQPPLSAITPLTTNRNQPCQLHQNQLVTS